MQSTNTSVILYVQVVHVWVKITKKLEQVKLKKYKFDLVVDWIIWKIGLLHRTAVVFFVQTTVSVCHDVSLSEWDMLTQSTAA